METYDWSRWLEQGVASGELRALDLHFGRWMGRIAGAGDPELILAAALASRRVGEGDVCLDLAEHAGRPLPAGDAAGPLAPSLGAWRQRLRAAAVVAAPGEGPAPLVLDRRDRLYLGRYWDLEHSLAVALRVRAGAWVEGVDRALLRAGLARMFPGGEGVDWQRVAAAVAVLRPLCVISGGPGTGKTRTVTAILGLLLEQAGGRPFRIALAAPTGKAAARLAESIAQARRALALDSARAAAIPEEAVTLHRLLGFRPGRAEPRHGRLRPLHLDVLVVDEASMVDLPMMSRLLAALPDSARLILLGDKDQLASVEAGKVLGDICGSEGPPAYSSEQRAVLAEVGAYESGGVALDARPTASDARPAAALADHVVVLRKSYRFQTDSGIGALARLVNAGRTEEALEVLGSAEYPDVTLVEHGEGDAQAWLGEHVVGRYRTYLEASDPGAALRELARFRLLCAVRGGPHGVEALNRGIESALAGAGLIRPRGLHYPGRPVMVTENDYAQGLFNGDIGLLLRNDPANPARLRCFFASPEGVRRLLPARLPRHETVYAMTVHKSQGSELDEVLLILPETASRVVTRELIYTAVTRARRRVVVLGSAEVLRRAIEARVVRRSGLREALWEDGGEP